MLLHVEHEEMEPFELLLTVAPVLTQTYSFYILKVWYSYLFPWPRVLLISVYRIPLWLTT